MQCFTTETMFSKAFQLLAVDFHRYEVLIFSVLAALAAILFVISILGSRARGQTMTRMRKIALVLRANKRGMVLK